MCFDFLYLGHLKYQSNSLLQHFNIRWFLLFIMYVDNVCEHMSHIYIYIYIYIYINAEGVIKTEDVTEDWNLLHIVAIPDCTYCQTLAWPKNRGE